ncbi:MAG TPA: type I DNA topoisomerase [Candidatus Saccharimonadales bacterium]|nr:type I DNA topoisomerase [Candidatus Saccharimonadales bacterium]
MAKNLVIVESPAKAKTIARYLGEDFEVKSSFGHIRDLPKKDLGVDINNNFQPTYQISPDKKKVVSELKKAAAGHTVWLASDEDREGEAIAWHICAALGLDPQTTNRIVFHEITKPAIEKAVANPRHVDKQLVNAQQSRRVLDRLVGYELSPILWRKIRTGLSAGRVQSAAVRLTVEREREIRDYQPEINFKVSADFTASGQSLPAELDRRPAGAEQAKELLEYLAKADFTVAGVDQKPGTRSPSPPFTTSTLQQEASRRLGFSVRQTMVLAQRLYENGHITYMRTDSTILSSLAISAAGTLIKQKYGANYAQNRQYKTKSQSAQEAHEAIRPTNFSLESAGADDGQKKLYQLIWRRALASQMAPAAIQRTLVMIDISGRPEKFTASGEVLTFDGFLKVYGGGKDDVILPAIKVGDHLELKRAQALETYSKPPARYSEASLVRQLEQLGIGRPSTYAPTIGTIQDRGYVEKKDVEGQPRELKEVVLADGKVTESVQTVVAGADRSKLQPTPLAEVVTDFLIKYFSDILNYDFTARAEAQLDEVADGKLAWQTMLKEFYDKFHPLVEKSAKADRAEAAQARTLGTDPKTGKPVIARYGRYGPMLQLGEAADKDDPKPDFAPLPQGASLDDVTLEQALPMFDLPRKVGQTEEGEEILANIGRYGPYLKVGKRSVSIKGQDPLTITEAVARQTIAENAKAKANRVIADFGAVKILRGPYGPYVTDGKTNARIPKKQNPEELDEQAAKDLLARKPARRGSRAKKLN